MNHPRKRLVIAGQTPPPLGGQTIMIRRLLDELTENDQVATEHLPFYFTKDTQSARKAGLGKLFELACVLGRLLRLRLRGPIDLLVFPAGGPQLVPVIRDLCLLPFVLLAAEKTVIHFHAGGIADHLARLPSFIRQALKFLGKRADAALVMTDFGRRDPLSLGITRILCVPHALADTFDPALLQRENPGAPRLLYVGHLCEDKGTMALLQALGKLRKSGLAFHLVLVGECLAPCTPEQIRSLLQELDLTDCVEMPGILRNAAKWERFAQAELFIFPTIAPYESFGLAMVEAMMWSLPVVATDWRGNREILTAQNALAERLSFLPETDLAGGLANSLEYAFQQRENWETWGKANRLAFDQRFNATNFPHRLATELVKYALVD